MSAGCKQVGGDPGVLYQEQTGTPGEKVNNGTERTALGDQAMLDGGISFGTDQAMIQTLKRVLKPEWIKS